MRKRGWGYTSKRGGAMHRVYDLLMMRFPWWDWGHRLMALVGDDFGGNWSEPSPPTWWYRLGTPKRMWRTGYPIHPLSTFEIVTDYDEFRRRTEGLNEDQMYEWKAICTDQDGQLQLGHRYWGGNFYGLTDWETRLLVRYLRMARRHDWWGIRSWLYKQGLEAAVHTRKPRACNEVPPRDSGGYDHWHCQLKRRHAGLHRFRSYTWGEIDNEPVFAHVPEEAMPHV